MRPMSGSIQCFVFPSVLWHSWLGNTKGIQPVKFAAIILKVFFLGDVAKPVKKKVS